MVPLGIQYAEIVGTRMAEEGSGGYTVNSTSYSVLVYYKSGLVNLVEGNAKAIQPYLAYMRPHNDTDRMEALLTRLEEKLKKDFDRVIEENIGKVYNAAYPIPDISGKRYAEAREELEKASFIVELSNPKHKPEADDIVDKCIRKAETMRTVFLRLIPDVTGQPWEDAARKLRDSGFNVKEKRLITDEYPDATVIRTEFIRDSSEDVMLYYCDIGKLATANPEDNFIIELENRDSMAEIYELWNEYGLAEKYKNIEAYIKMRKDSEVKDGRPKNLDQIKEIIAQMLQKEMQG